jgi:hypothetical protein
MEYQEHGSDPPHFDGKNYHMWQRRMAAFLRGKGQNLWDVTVNTAYVHPMNFLAPGSRDMFDVNNKAVDYLYRFLCESEYERVRTEDLACRICEQLKNAHVGMLWFRLGSLRPTGESTRTSLISPESPWMPCFSVSR